MYCRSLLEEEISYNIYQKTEVVKEPNIPLEKVRIVLAEKSQQGFTAEVRGIIAKYGAEKLSAVDKVYYANILEDAEGLGNG